MGLRRIILCAAALCACGAPAIHADISERLAVDVRLRVDPSLASRRIADHMKAETEAIWTPYGIRLKWADAAAGEVAASSISLDASLVRRFEGPEPVEWTTVLGRAVVRPDALRSRPIRVSFDATEHVLAVRMTGRVAGAALVLDSDLARALGRVLAHEIGHVLLGAPYHDRAGLMRSAFRANELAEPNRRPFRLTCSGVDRLRSRIRTLSGDSQVGHPRNSTMPDVAGVRATTSEWSVGASCIPIQSAH